MPQRHFLFVKQKTPPGKRGEQVFSRSPRFVYSAAQWHSEALAGLWPGFARTLTTKGITGHDSVTLGCLTPFRFPHLPEKVSFYTGGDSHRDKQREKGEREEKEENQLLSAAGSQGTEHAPAQLPFSTACKQTQRSPEPSTGRGD